MTKSFKKPKKYTHNIVVIGAGAAGLVTSYISAALKAKVALIEKNKMGGDCLNYGCVPSKALIRSAKVVHQIQNAKKYGIHTAQCEFEFKDIMSRVHKIIKAIEPHDSVERYSRLGVECIEGAAKIISPYEVEVNGKILTTKAIVVATGAAPIVPKITGLEDIEYLTSDNLWELTELPKNLLVLGGGPIGCELAQSFNRLGSKVTLLENSDTIMAREDQDVSAEITKKFQAEGIKLLTGYNTKSFQKTESGGTLIAKKNGEQKEIHFDKVLISVGRRARVTGFGLEDLGVELNKNGTVKVDDYLATNYKNIFVCGDVAGPYQFTHVAAHQAYYAAVNGLFLLLTRWAAPFAGKSVKAHYSVIPWATYTDPEVATVGLTEKTALAHKIPYELTKYGIDDLDRAIADDEAYGFVKVLTEPKSDKILGATIVGQHASDMIGEFICAMRFGFGLKSIMGTIHIYPTMSEANKYAAGAWSQARKPLGLLNILEKLHAWRRN
ncbi:MAG: dihydrolipoyl dehydrogenase [Bdellovibrionales bacterium]|nr:dihydrolipoyl dehydrogenase [Bdellovibrionales bacterium]